MKFVLVIAVLVCLASAIPRTPSSKEGSCTVENCKRENGCACASTESPIETDKTPQFVTFTFDDSVTNYNYETYYEPLLRDRKNPDGSKISANFYVPHEYTDYERVNNLYNAGHDIGDFSVSKNGEVEYWSSASVKQLTDEFHSQRTIISKFANIPKEDIVGVRTPHMELNSINSFQSYVAAGLKYDNTWTTTPSLPLFPYTLDYVSKQPCLIGKCPDQPVEGFWVLPVINVYGKDKRQCNVLFACGQSGSSEELKNWLVTEFDRIYKLSRAPITFLVNAAWFQLQPNSFEALNKFIDYLGTKKDVFLVSHSEVLRWAKKPVPLSEYKTLQTKRNTKCLPVVCPLPFGQQETRYMKSCTPCPDVYPWLGNPTGTEAS